jgi:hypothetical protein
VGLDEIVGAPADGVQHAVQFVGGDHLLLEAIGKGGLAARLGTAVGALKKSMPMLTPQSPPPPPQGGGMRR